MHPLDYPRPDRISETRNRDRLDHDLSASIYSGRRASTMTFSIAALMCKYCGYGTSWRPIRARRVSYNPSAVLAIDLASGWNVGADLRSRPVGRNIIRQRATKMAT
jgi:hypothetical protein